MKEEINVKICLGPDSYAKGSMNLLKVSEFIPVELKNRIKISGAVSLNEPKENAPYASVNGSLIENASIEKILDSIEALV